VAKYITLKEMAKILSRCPKTFARYVELYDIPHIRLGRDLLFDPAKVEAHLEAQSEKRRTKRIELAKPRIRNYPNADTDRYAQLLGLVD
jgi:hypothetical protein